MSAWRRLVIDYRRKNGCQRIPKTNSAQGWFRRWHYHLKHFLLTIVSKFKDNHNYWITHRADINQNMGNIHSILCKKPFLAIIDRHLLRSIYAFLLCADLTFTISDAWQVVVVWQPFLIIKTIEMQLISSNLLFNKYSINAKIRKLFSAPFPLVIVTLSVTLLELFIRLRASISNRFYGSRAAKTSLVGFLCCCKFLSSNRDVELYCNRKVEN